MRRGDPGSFYGSALVNLHVPLSSGGGIAVGADFG